MLKDISNWELVGYGGKSTLEKEELRSPDGKYYLIKYPRQFEKGVSWEDITELVAAEVGTLYGLEMMKVEIVTRNGRRGCLLENFVKEYEAMMAEEGGALLSELLPNYQELLETPLKNLDLIEYGFEVMERFPYWSSMKPQFINLQLFDTLIGNQDRHPFNWTLLFLSTGVRFSPIYDNGASLGFRFDDSQLRIKVSNSQELNKYTNRTKVKAGIFEKKKVKAKELLTYISQRYPMEFYESVQMLRNLNIDQYSKFIRSLSILSEAQRDWLLNIIPFRREKILEWIREEEI